MTATYEHCTSPGCGNWQDTALLGDRCTSCGRPLIAAVEHQAIEPQPSPAPSPIVARHKYLSPSARRAETTADAAQSSTP
jgi:hypothetical protein